MRLLRYVVLVGILALPGTFSYCQTTLQSAVVGSGGMLNASNGTPNSFISGTIGQPIISGEVALGSSSRWEGFWVPAYKEPTSVDDGSEIVGDGVRIYPNPMRETARISFDAKLEGPVTVRVYDAVGTLVQTVEQELSVAGEQTIQVDVIADSGDQMASGAYLCVIDGLYSNGKPFHTTVRLSVVK